MKMQVMRIRKQWLPLENKAKRVKVLARKKRNTYETHCISHLEGRFETREWDIVRARRRPERYTLFVYHAV